MGRKIQTPQRRCAGRQRAFGGGRRRLFRGTERRSALDAATIAYRPQSARIMGGGGGGGELILAATDGHVER